MTHHRPMASAAFAANIDTWRFILIAMVVLNHALLLSSVEANMGAIERASVILTRAGVPTLSLFSGFLLASSASRGPRDLLTKKARSLILPFLFWNTTIVLVLLGANELWRFDPAELIAAQSRYELVNDLSGFHGAPANSPLYFLRDLFICFLVAAVLRPVLRHPVGIAIALAAAVANYMLDLDGRAIIRNTIPVFFLAGFALRAAPRLIELCGRLVPLTGCVTAGLLIVWALGDMSWGKASPLDLLTLATSTALVVGLASRLQPTPRLAAWGRRYSFTIFLSHWWVLLASQALWGRMDWDSLSLRILVGVTAILLGVMAARLIAYLPGPIAAAVSGGRVKRAARQTAPAHALRGD